MSAQVEHLPEFGVTVISEWIFNCYVIHDGGAGRPFVVDAGVPSYAAPVTEVLRSLGCGPTDLAVVAATHGHLDHVAGMPALAAVGAPHLALPAKIRDYLGHDGRPPETPRSPGPRAIARIYPVMRDQRLALSPYRELAPSLGKLGFDGRGAHFPFEPSSWLGEGDPVPGAPDWITVHAPGHTDDELCFYDARRRILLSGDAVLAVGRRAWFNPEFVDAELSERTEARLRTLDVELLLPGHGRAVASHALWDEALGCHDRPRGERARGLRRLLRAHR